jgi:hypothetical protein
MIKLSDRFSIKRDKYQWVLTESTKTKEGKTREERTFHATLDQVASCMLHKGEEGCDSMGDLRTLYKQALNGVADMIKGRV